MRIEVKLLNEVEGVGGVLDICWKGLYYGLQDGVKVG